MTIVHHVTARAVFAVPLLLGVLPVAPAPAEAPAHYVHWSSTNQWFDRRLDGRDDTVPGEVTSPHPTLANLSLEWRIEGDDDLDGTVTVAYRPAGDGAWHDALPLRRVPGGVYESHDGNPSTWHWDNMHAGSILDLHPDTEYEIALRLHDPDGGTAERTMRVRTRAEPADMPGARIRRVTVQTLREEAARAEPGDVFLLAGGNYGFFHPPCDGLPGRPIVFRADPEDSQRHRWGRNSAIVQFAGVSLTGRKHVHLDGLLSTDSIDLFGAESCVVRRCIVHALWGIVSGWTPNFAASGPRTPRLGGLRPATPTSCRDCLISDNFVTGATPWLPVARGAAGMNLGEGIQVAGPGNIIRHNRVRGFRDCISLMEGPHAIEQLSVDIYNNDVSEGLDDGIEADYAWRNCRIVRNRVTNCARGLALSPVLGGPAYVVRNVLFNTAWLWQFNRAGTGYVALHNTSVSLGRPLTLGVHGHVYARNNLFIGGSRPEQDDRGNRPDAAAPPAWDYDHNGFGDASDQLGVMRARGQERHGVRIGSDVFQNPPRVPDSLFPEQPPPDFALRAGSAAVDAGEILPNITDGFTGRAPDLGARELGHPEPVYGPRPEVWEE